VERERLALILDGMSEAVVVVDPEGAVVSANRAYETAFGPGAQIRPQDGAGQELPTAEWPQARAARGESFSMSFTQLDPGSGDRRWYEAIGRGVGGSLGGIIVIRDITDRSLRHLQERFIDAASHELKTPLAAMHNYLQLVERGGRDSLDATTVAYLQRAIEQSRDLGELAARLFDVSLIRHGRLVVEHKAVDLRELLSEAIGEVRIVNGSPQIEARLGRRRVTVNGDRLRLRQVLTNLLVNAVTHGASADPVSVTLEADDARATVRIADRGPGISRPVQTQLFTPFVATAANGVEGLGLGLFLARAIALAHGGTLTVEGRSGGGTEVIVALPVAHRRTARSAPPGAGEVVTRPHAVQGARGNGS
jgi:two-component system CheB/CheR fusion protein